MKSLVDDLRAFFVAIWKSWVGLTSAFVSIIGWTIGSLVSMPISAHWIFLGGGTLAMLVACFVTWRRERSITNAREAYLQLMRVVEVGEKRLADYNSVQPGADLKTIANVIDLQTWHDDTLRILKTSYSAHWSYFSDIDTYKADAAREQSISLLKRIQVVCELIKKET